MIDLYNSIRSLTEKIVLDLGRQSRELHLLLLTRMQTILVKKIIFFTSNWSFFYDNIK